MSIPTRIPLNALQKAVYGLLSRRLDTKTPIYDFVAKGAERSYITFGRLNSKPDGAKDVDISTCVMEFNIFSKSRGRAEINNIAEDIVNVLTKYKVKMLESGFNVLSKEYINFESDSIEGFDGYVAILTFQFRIQNIKGVEETKNETETP